VGIRENEDIFLRELRVGVKWGIKKRGKGRAPQPIFVYATRVEAWAKRNL